jgi:hypothetical protein
MARGGGALSALRAGAAVCPLAQAGGPLPGLRAGLARPPRRRFSPYIAILVTGHVMAPVLIALGLETTLSAPVMMALCLIPTAGLVLGLLPVAKGAVIALQWWLGLHGFATAPGRDLVEK